jgi:YVTN family beta-propeller protein
MSCFRPLAAALAALVLALVEVPAFAQTPLDYDVFKARIQPVFLAKREGHARCYSCHRGNGTGNGYLQALTPGATMWDEAQTRKNFESIQRFVVAGNPLGSRLLRHPLDEHAGGDEFHGGGKHWESQQNPEWQTLAAWVRGASGRMAPGRVRIVQTNSAGDNVYLIDPATNTVAAVIKGIEVPHGAAAAPDGSRLYFSNESESSLDVVDGKTLAVLKRIPLTGRPNNIDIAKDGRKVYVSIAQAPGAVDVIDTATMQRVKSMPVEGAVHNTYVTPDGRFIVAGSIAGRKLTVIDAATEQIAWTLPFENGVRPIAFEKKADGSTARMFVQISELHGFAVVDFAARKEIARVMLPDPPPPAVKHTEGVQGSPSHGIGITPDGKTLWATSKYYGYVAAYSMPDLTLLGIVPVGHDPDWLTFTPDSTTVYVACAGSDFVVAVDVASRREVARIPVGFVPKRNITVTLSN